VVLDSALANLRTILLPSLIGGAVIVICVAVGWRAGRRRTGWLVRCTRYWFDRVAGPLLASGSWAKRALIIAANNSLVCFALVILGALGHLAWLGLAAVGLGLGAALRLMLDLPLANGVKTRLSWRKRVLAGLGIVLNLLEPPAILLSAGLSLAQGAMGDALDLRLAVLLYVQFVLPVLVVAAGGEALWLTVYNIRSAGRDESRQIDEPGSPRQGGNGPAQHPYVPPSSN
jgi:hypothetical protein